jgi:hypothetical protein
MLDSGSAYTHMTLCGGLRSSSIKLSFLSNPSAFVVDTAAFCWIILPMHNSTETRTYSIRCHQIVVLALLWPPAAECCAVVRSPGSVCLRFSINSNMRQTFSESAHSMLSMLSHPQQPPSVASSAPDAPSEAELLADIELRDGSNCSAGATMCSFLSCITVV